MGNTFHATLIKICSNELIVRPSKTISKEDFATGKNILKFNFESGIYFVSSQEGNNRTSYSKILQRDELGINCKAAGIFPSHNI